MTEEVVEYTQAVQTAAGLNGYSVLKVTPKCLGHCFKYISGDFGVSHNRDGLWRAREDATLYLERKPVKQRWACLDLDWGQQFTCICGQALSYCKPVK